MVTFKKAEYNPNCKVLRKVFQKNSTFHSFNYRKGHPEVFCKKGVIKNFAKSTGKHLCQSLFLNEVAGLAKFIITPSLTEHLWSLLL